MRYGAFLDGIHDDPRVPISFEAWPTRHVPPVGEARWTVQIHRGGAWPGWRWLDRMDEGMAVGSAGFVMAVLALTLPLPSIAWRRLRYRLGGRTDWDVLIYRGEVPDYRPRDAVKVENAPTKRAAIERAEALWSVLCERDHLPQEP